MFLTETRLQWMRFRKLGKNVKISDKASIYNPENISIGNNVRIDDFAIISAGEDGIVLGNNVHIACYCSLIGNAKISVGNYCGISSRCSVYSSTDDYSGEWLSNPTVPDEFKNVFSAPVTLQYHVLIGAGCVILPGVTFGDGATIASMSLVNKDIPEYTLYGGVPAKFIRNQSTGWITKSLGYDQCS